MLRNIKNIKHFFWALLAVIWYRYPARDLLVVGVTGTDGKSTTVALIHHLFNQAGLKAAMVSTLGAKAGEKNVSVGLHVTTPDPFKIQKLMRTAVNEGIRYFVLEATSHGLDQHRLLGCNFRVAVMTNLTAEHLDYHGSQEKYFNAKAKLFKGVRYAVLNHDDQSYMKLKKSIPEERTSIISYGLKKNAYLSPDSFDFQTRLQGKFNRYNCLAAIAVAQIFEIPAKDIRRALQGFLSPKGRLEEIKHDQKFRVFVDFAHTPGAFKQVLPTVRNLTEKRLIHVFGCTGDRDKSKRPVMGELSAKSADLVILTHEDTYREEPREIISQIEVGVKNAGKEAGKSYWCVTDRRQAIRQAIGMAGKGDTVLITGVGHQESLNIGGKEVPWSDQKEVKEALGELKK